MKSGSPPPSVRGRGTAANPPCRYHSTHRVAIDDGWTPDDAPVTAPPTRVTPDAARTVVTFNRSPDVPFDRSVNPYRGCEHGCIYCYARPTHAYLGLSPGLDFESRLFAKADAPALLEAELRASGYRCAPVALGTNTDPYQPVEREWGITRGILEVLRAFRHPVMIVTKSALVERDIDLLAPMAAQGLASVTLSVTTLDRKLARRLEPRAAAPQRRLETLRRLHEAGIPTGVLFAPVIPALNDAEMETVLEQCAACGVRTAAYVLLRLPLEVEGLFEEWLHTHVPMRAAHVMSVLRQCHGGQAYDAEFGRRMRGEGAYAELIRRRFEVACRRLRLNDREAELDTGQFAPPPRAGDQLSLL